MVLLPPGWPATIGGDGLDRGCTRWEHENVPGTRTSLWVIPVEGPGMLAPGVMICSAIAAVYRRSVEREVQER